jgi:hypothetical protein
MDDSCVCIYIVPQHADEGLLIWGGYVCKYFQKSTFAWFHLLAYWARSTWSWGILARLASYSGVCLRSAAPLPLTDDGRFPRVYNI